MYVQALYAIIGALSLEQGALVANRVARERILSAVRLRGDPTEELGQDLQ